MSKGLCVGIDASRCRSGGAHAHLVGILTNADPTEHGIDHVHLWSFQRSLDAIPDYPWLMKHAPHALEGSLWRQLLWQAVQLKDEVKQADCDVLFTADASTLCRFKPQVVLSQDMLSYEPGVMRLFGWGKARLRLLTILWLQNMAFRHADGVIFLTHYAGGVIQQSCGPLPRVAYIPHGVGSNFQQIQRQVKWPKPGERPIRCLYVSNAALYKHQWVVVRAVEMLRKQGIDINSDTCRRRIGQGAKKTRRANGSIGSTPCVCGAKRICSSCRVAGLSCPSGLSSVFASSCENMPNHVVGGDGSRSPYRML